MKEITMTCEACDGTGIVGLDPHLKATLEAFTNREMTAEQIQSKLEDDVTHGAVCNRLRRLHLLNLVTRRRNGKYWLYRKALRK